MQHLTYCAATAAVSLLSPYIPMGSILFSKLERNGCVLWKVSLVL